MNQIFFLETTFVHKSKSVYYDKKNHLVFDYYKRKKYKNKIHRTLQPCEFSA